MKKLIVLTAVTSILLVAGQQQAWAGNRPNYHDDDYRTFRKIVRVLDDLVNDDCRRGKNYVSVRTYYYPSRVCYVKGPRKVCHLRHHGPQRYDKPRRYRR